MYSVFSDTKKKPSETIKELQRCAGSEFDRILLAGPEDEPLYMLKPEAIYVLRWINRKILFILPEMDNRTVGVRLRIATGMINNLERSNVIPKDVCIAYHDRLVKRVSSIFSAIMTEDLPFLG